MREVEKGETTKMIVACKHLSQLIWTDPTVKMGANMRFSDQMIENFGPVSEHSLTLG